MPVSGGLPGWLKSFPGQFRKDFACGALACHCQLFRGLEHVLVDIQSCPHKDSVTHQASGVNRD